MPCVVDLAALRDAMAEMGGDPAAINPLVPVELVIDHSVQVDAFGSARAFQINAESEYERNGERYAFLRWGQTAFEGFKVVPPDTGIVHQVNLEYLARVVFEQDGVLYPDTLVGTDSHTTMINGLGVLGWGVGGIEAEAAMLGQPMSMLIPRVVGFKLQRRAARGRDRDRPRPDRHRAAAPSTASSASSSSSTARASRTCRSPTARRSATCRPSSARPARSSRSTPRRCATSSSPAARPSSVERVETYAKAQGLWHDDDTRGADLLRDARARPRRGRAVARRPEAPAGPRLADRGQGVVPDGARRPRCPSPTTCDEPLRGVVPGVRPAGAAPASPRARPTASDAGAGTGGAQVADRVSAAVPLTLADGTETELDHGHVVIAAITSCTNTSNPSVMIGAGLLARNAVERGLKSKPWVKTSLAPGSKVVMEYYARGRTDRAARGARLPPRRLRLHDVHRQLRAAAGRGLRRGQRRATSRSSPCSAATATSRAGSTPT